MTRLERSRALRVLLALGLVELVACGSVTTSPLVEGDAAAGDGDATGAAGASSGDARADLGTSRDAGAELAPAPLAACPAFQIAEDCHTGSTGGGQSYGYCYVCTSAAGAPITGCSNGKPKPDPGGNVCVASCADCQAR